MRAACLLVLAAGLLGCQGDDKARPGGPGGGGAPTVDAGPLDDGARVPCLDRPGELPRPPGAALPCDLLPPGFGK